jgi:uncharacterized protein YraI
MPSNPLTKPTACLVAALLLGGCGLNAPRAATVIVTVPQAPTNTLAPVITSTMRLTATPIPTSTFIPTATAPPTITPLIPTATVFVTATPFVGAAGKINLDRGTVNLRAGPSTDFRQLTKIEPGAALTVLSLSDDRLWYFVIAPGGFEGWVSAELVTVTGNVPVAVVPALELTQRAAGGRATVELAVNTPAATIAYRADKETDILAYCDLPGFRAEAGKTFSSGENLTIFWNWFARTREQIQDHLSYGSYDVTIDLRDGQTWNTLLTLENWRSFRTDVIAVNRQQRVYWYVPIGKLKPGEYRINYRLSWSQKIEDGDKTFGPGGAEEINTGTCRFTVR